MAESIRERYRRWGLEELLLKYPGLRPVPATGYDLVIRGEVAFDVQGPVGEPLADAYVIEMAVAMTFPRELPNVRDVGGRIPRSYHTNPDDTLCLGAITELVLALGRKPTLVTYLEKCVIPFLYGHSYFRRHGVMPYGELDHGTDGLRQQFATLFGAPDRASAQEFVRLAAMRKRHANKEPCPCGSGRRLGRCHNERVNRIRGRLGRPWFRDRFAELTSARQCSTECLRQSARGNKNDPPTTEPLSSHARHTNDAISPARRPRQRKNER